MRCSRKTLLAVGCCALFSLSAALMFESHHLNKEDKDLKDKKKTPSLSIQILPLRFEDLDRESQMKMAQDVLRVKRRGPGGSILQDASDEDWRVCHDMLGAYALELGALGVSEENIALVKVQGECDCTSKTFKKLADLVVQRESLAPHFEDVRSGGTEKKISMNYLGLGSR